jgi:transcription elongation factor GreA
MQITPTYLTPEGKQKLQAELQHLRAVRRKEVAERIRIALESSDAVGNPEFDQAKAEQSFLEGRIIAIESMLSNSVMIETSADGHDEVHIGSEVVLCNEDGEEERYTIVGKAEANPRLGKISNESPIGRALLGRRPGEELSITAPGGERHLRIVSTT